MKTNVNCIVFEFNTKCPECGAIDEDFPEVPIKSDIISILDCGTPICQVCNADMELMEECEVRA